MVSDTVGDFIIQLKNAGVVGKSHVSLPYSKLKFSIAKKLEEKGYVAAVSADNNTVGRKLTVELAYTDGKRARISGVKRMSKPGRRLYAKVSDIHPVKFGKGNMFLSTPAGILTDDEARVQNVGGEELFMIW